MTSRNRINRFEIRLQSCGSIFCTQNPDGYRVGYRKRGDEVYDFKNDG